MSTKTLHKRIALVAVSALGLGLMSVIPAQAVEGDQYTSGATLSTSSLTVVGTATTNANAGFFYVDTAVTDTVAATTAVPNSGLRTDESMTVSVITAPAVIGAVTPSINDIYIQPVTLGSTVAANATNVADGITRSNSVQIPQGSIAVPSSYASANSSFAAASATSDETNRYWFAVYPGAASPIGSGTYTIRVRIFNQNSSVIDKTLSVKFVSTIADAGATLTLAKTGSVQTGTGYAYTANTSMRATLKDADGGRVVTGISSTASSARTNWTPALNANMLAADGTVGESLTIADSGVTAVDHVSCGGATCTAVTTATLSQTDSEAVLAAGNGVYGITDTTIAAAAESAASFRVRVTGAAASAELAIAVVTATSATAAGTAVTATATGLLSAHTVARTVASSALAYTIPTATSAVSLSIDTNGAAGDVFNATTTWSGNYVGASVTPATTTSTNYTAGDGGKFTVSLTNSSNVTGGVATIVVNGFTDATTKNTFTLTWADAKATTITVVDPTDGVFVKLASATVFNVSVTDQFGNAVASTKLQPSVTGANNAAGTNTYAFVTTDANGLATFTLTDAVAIADETDTVSFASISNTSATAGSRTITYKTTLPVVSTMSNYYSQTFIASTAATVTLAVPSAGIQDTAGGVTLVIARNQSKSLAANANSATDDMVAVRVRSLTSAGVAAKGAAITLTAGTGGHVLNTSGLPASSRTVAADTDGDVFFSIMATGTGTITWTVTSGTASSTIKLVVADQTYTAARTVALTGSTTGSANGAGVPMTATVKDRYGNGVANVNLIVTASGVGSFMGGSTSQSFTTDANGTYTFLATSTVADGGSATFSVRASNATDAASIAGYTGSSSVDSTLAAGIASATATVTFAAGTNAAEANAQAATDAAAEATDAANAATDAANAAAEAADAATAAAQDAADAVAALSAQVATLISGLKAQLTALTNLVIKIQKKVKA